MTQLETPRPAVRTSLNSAPRTRALPTTDRIEALLESAGLEPRDGFWRHGDGVAAVLAGGGVFIGWLDVVWPGPGTPELQLRDVVHLPPGRLDELELTATLAVARERAESARRSCRYCGERVVPGHMHSADVCQGCAERHLGVVH